MVFIIKKTTANLQILSYPINNKYVTPKFILK